VAALNLIQVKCPKPIRNDKRIEVTTTTTTGDIANGSKTASKEQGFATGGMGPIIILRGNNPQDRMSALGQKQTSKHCPVNVRFTPKNRHRRARGGCPLCAKSRHWAPQQKRRYSILVRQLLPAATCGGPPEPRSKSNWGR
jgi:hypothetical protein